MIRTEDAGGGPGPPVWIDAPVPPSAVAVARAESIHIRPSRAGAAEWDAFVQRCHGSFRGAFWAARAWQFEVHRLHRLYRWDVCRVTPDGDEKIGQCAVGVGRKLSVFSDGLHLLPAHAAQWAAAMDAVLARMGPAAYVYGSEWSLEVPRENALSGLPGVRIDRVQPTTVQVIDFSRWSAFDDYRKAVSSNVRRNVKKAEKSYASLTIVEKNGLAPIGYFVKGVSLRRALFHRKGVDRSAVGMALRSAARLMSLRKYSRAAYLLADAALLGSYVGVDFGNQYCYLEGASDPDGKGTSWFLLMAMIERAFVHSQGGGRFVMGSDDGSQAGVAAWEGLRRSRQQACALPVPTSVVEFTYRP